LRFPQSTTSLLGIQELQPMKGHDPQASIIAMKILQEKGKGTSIPRFSNEFQEPPAQATVCLMGKLVNELLDIFMCMREQEMKSIFLQLRIALAH